MSTVLALAALFAQAPMVETRVVDGEILCTVRASSTPADEIAHELARTVGRMIDGLEEFAPLPAIDVELVDRPWTDVLERVLGAAGVRARFGASIAVERDTAPHDVELAEARLRAALRAFPDHAESAAARFDLARLLDRRGEHRAARATWEEIAARTPRSPLVADAWRASAESAVSEEEGDDAARALSALGALVEPHAHHAFARRELARVLARRGDADAALSILQTLDALDPTRDRNEQRDRLIARAEALVAATRHAEALRAIDEALRIDRESAYRADLSRARGDALAGLGDPCAASFAWLEAAQASDGGARARAFARAGELALAARDALGALAIARAAEAAGASSAVPELTARALRALGIGPAERSPIERHVEAAEEALATNDQASAGAHLAALDALALEPALDARRTVASASLIALERGLEPALDALRRAAAVTSGAEARRSLFAGAATLLEKRGLFARAADALEGEL